MKKIAIILALILILGTVFISGCATHKNNTTTGNGSNQSKNPTGYVVQVKAGNYPVISLNINNTSLESDHITSSERTV